MRRRGFDYATVLLSVAGRGRAQLRARAALPGAARQCARVSLALQDDNLEIAGFRVQAGLVSSLDQRTGAQRSARRPRRRSRSSSSNYNAAVSRLGVLTGQAPGALKAELAAVQADPDRPGRGRRRHPRRHAAPAPRRPRRRAQPRRRDRADRRRQGAALSRAGDQRQHRHQRRPRSAICASTITGGLFAGLTQAIFNGGRLRSAGARRTRPPPTARSPRTSGTVLTALEDVENALVALRHGAARASASSRSRSTPRTTPRSSSRSQYRAGLTDFTTLNTAGSGAAVGAQRPDAGAADQATALVQLYVALGGGWDCDRHSRRRPRHATGSADGRPTRNSTTSSARSRRPRGGATLKWGAVAIGVIVLLLVLLERCVRRVAAASEYATAAGRARRSDRHRLGDRQARADQPGDGRLAAVGSGHARWWSTSTTASPRASRWR